MKKLFLISLLTFISFSIFSQQINKELVVVEIKTGTWCQYCPGAAMGADDLVKNFGDAVAIIENHGGDDYQNTASTSRLSYYPSSGYPTAYFNGGNSLVGGNSNTSLYPSYLPRYNSALAVMTSFDVTMDVTIIDSDTYNVTVTIDKVHDYSGTSLVAHLALTESHIEESWQGMDELNFVNRAMYPTPSGTVLDFSSVNQQIINYTVTINEEWIVEECELVAFMQDNNSKEILQGTKESLNIPIGTNNVMLDEINYPSGDYTICEDAVSPVITIKNRGNANLTTCNINYEINNEGVQTYNWTGNLAFDETEEIVLDEIIYSPVSTNTLEINLSSPNGLTDDDLSNNSMDVNFDKSIETTSRTYLEIDPGGSFGLSWVLTNSDNETLYSGNVSGDDVITEIFFLSMDECYKLTLTSTMGNGIPGGGYFKLTDSENNEIYYCEGTSFTDEIIVPFKVTVLSGITEQEINSIQIYPNPATDYLNINVPEEFTNTEIVITNVTGKVVKSFEIQNRGNRFSVNELSKGIYFVSLINDKKVLTTRKLIIN